jgi:predicted alpha/beta superfamily hydrolase
MFNIYSAPTQNWTITPHFYSGMGRYEYFRNLYNKYSDNFRDLVVYLPPSFSENKYANYPTLIMHDGQNLFNDSTSFGGRSWRCADTLNDQMGRGLMEEIIVVGVDNTADRTDEYTYSVDPEYGGGKGDLYLDFLEETVIPYVKNAFGSRAMLDREYLGILGSSLGGLISCYAGWTRPAVYSRVGCMSSSFWWNTEDFNTTVLEKYPSPTQGLPAGSIFYLDSGTDAVTSTCGIVDEDDCVQTSTVVSHMQYKHWSLDYDLFHYIMPRGQHSEYYWGTRFWSPMEALYPPQALN